jgi:hypothetical protein
MSEIHCHNCGGSITDPGSVSYVKPVDGTAAAGPHSALCTCKPAVIYGPPSGYLAWSGYSSVSRSKSAALN